METHKDTVDSTYQHPFIMRHARGGNCLRVLGFPGDVTNHRAETFQCFPRDSVSGILID